MLQHLLDNDEGYRCSFQVSTPTTIVGETYLFYHPVKNKTTILLLGFEKLRAVGDRTVVLGRVPSAA
jgi:hypothetical protein